MALYHQVKNCVPERSCAKSKVVTCTSLFTCSTRKPPSRRMHTNILLGGLEWHSWSWDSLIEPVLKDEAARKQQHNTNHSQHGIGTCCRAGQHLTIHQRA
jgi:hypothetical protein